MCGIAGFLEPAAPHSRETLAAMGAALEHRGPDDSGVWFDCAAGVWFAHRRLSILDLSPAGHQPMHSASGRFTIVFNGEIYNFAELRDELAEYSYRGHSDTEVILAACERWGVETTVPRLDGMFAFALWDARERLLYLARDRAGEKPLYYGRCQRAFLFGSELKALKRHPAFNAALDREALALYLRYNYVPAPHTIYAHIRKLPPASLLTVSPGGETRLSTYWSASAMALAAEPFRGSENDAVEELAALARNAVRSRMVADVPVGAFLSGGIDSSLITALMREGGGAVRSFTIGFDDPRFNEAPFAKKVAAHLGADHTELYVTAADAMAVIPKLPELYDEPFGDSSQIPTHLVSRMARNHVKVALSGDAGDEVFGGYVRYLWAAQIWRGVGWMPEWARKATGSALLASRWSDRAQKLGVAMAASDRMGLYQRLVSHWQQPEQVVIGATCGVAELRGGALPDFNRPDFTRLDFTHQMMLLDTATYLPDDILVKVDRASMGVGLETRVPLLEPRLMEFAWSLPLAWKIRGGRGKWIVRRVLERYVPAALMERPKTGFAIPLGAWLRGPLREWAEDLLNEERLRREGFFHPWPVRKTWQEHLSGKRNWWAQLWGVLMFQSWLAAQ